MLSSNGSSSLLSQVNANKEAALAALNNAYEADKKTALQIWEYAEVGYKEVKSAALHVQHLKDAGFTVETGVAGIPTAFVATYGTGSPAIGMLAEYDALPGINQSTSPERDPIAGKNAGHACGHHLFGTASVSAGIAIKELIAAGKLKGQGSITENERTMLAQAATTLENRGIDPELAREELNRIIPIYNYFITGEQDVPASILKLEEFQGFKVVR